MCRAWATIVAIIASIHRERHEPKRAERSHPCGRRLCSERSGVACRWLNSAPRRPFILHLFAALAEMERALIGVRTKAALAAAKARGVRLGNPRLNEARKAAHKTAAVANEAAAERQAATVLPIIREIKRAGARTLREIAEALTATVLREHDDECARARVEALSSSE